MPAAMRASIAAFSASSPSPVIAETATAPVPASGTPPTPPSRSALFSTSIVRDGQPASSVPSRHHILQHRHHVGALRRAVRMRGIADMQDHVGLGDLLQRGAERLDQLGAAVR